MIEFDTETAPELSVIVLTYGQTSWVERTLSALRANTDVPFELIVVDNNSPDSTARWLSENVTGATLHLLDENLGFGAGCNFGAKDAKAPVLCFLNSDALVGPQWASKLLIRLRSRADIGAVSPRLINEDGSLQEFGSVVGSDGITQAVGFGDSISRPYYRFVRVSDFASAACLVVDKQLFEQCGGFDPIYGLGYCEDVDVCLRMAQFGYKTVIASDVDVTHARGASTPSETVVERRDKNTEVLRTHWTEQLSTRPSLRDTAKDRNHQILARDAMMKNRVLVLANDGRLTRAKTKRIRRFLASLDAFHNRITVYIPYQQELDVNKLPLDTYVEYVCNVQDFDDWLQTRQGNYTQILADPRYSPDAVEKAKRYNPNADLTDVNSIPSRWNRYAWHRLIAKLLPEA